MSCAEIWIEYAVKHFSVCILIYLFLNKTTSILTFSFSSSIDIILKICRCIIHSVFMTC